jgi:hypothetical protein
VPISKPTEGARPPLASLTREAAAADRAAERIRRPNRATPQTVAPALPKPQRSHPFAGPGRRAGVTAATAETNPRSNADVATPTSRMAPGEKLVLTGPAATAPVADRVPRPVIDPIDFAELLRAALLQDARRHGIEV